MAQAQRVGAWIAAHGTREARTPGGLGDRIYASADAGTVSGDEAALLVRSLLTAGVDTTVIGLGCALDCLARDRDGKAVLVYDKDDPNDDALQLAYSWARCICRRELTADGPSTWHASRPP